MGAKTIDFQQLDRACEEAAHGERKWLEILREITGWVGGHKAMLLDRPGASSYSASLAFNHDPEALKAYNEGYNSSDPRRAQSFSTPVGKVGLGQEFVRNEDIVRTAYFADICETWDVRDSVHGIIADDEFGRLAISIQRGFDTDYFDADDGLKLEPILPILGRHLRAARRIASVTGGLGGDVEAFGCLLMPDMKFTTLVRTRPRLPASVQERLFFAFDQIRFDCARMRAVFDKCIAVALAGQSTSCQLFETVFRFSPVPNQLDWMAGRDKAVILTTGHKSYIDHITPFVEAHELTKREGDLLVRLVRGHDLRTSAAQLDISYETARWHLKNMCGKAGYDRSSALLEAARSGNISQMS